MRNLQNPSDILAVKQALATERYKALFLQGFPAEARRNSEAAIHTMEQWIKTFDTKPLCAALIQSGALQPTTPRRGLRAWLTKLLIALKESPQ